MKRLLLALLTLSAAACGAGGIDAEEFRSASPSRQGIDIKVPESTAKALTSGDYGSQQQKLLGQTANWYVVTRDMTSGINGGLASVLNLCEDIIRNEPTFIDDNHAVWGPLTSPLSPDVMRFAIAKDGAGFNYVLEGKQKKAPESAWVAIIHGRHESAGRGAFLIDWNATHTLASPAKDVGTAQFGYERNARQDLGVSVALRQVRDEESGELVDANYNFAQAASGEGAFEFVVPNKDMQNNGSLKERFAVMSRWRPDGSGRCDVEISGGDLGPATIHMTECWNDSFQRTFYGDSVGMEPIEGDPSTCAFSTESYTAL